MTAGDKARFGDFTVFGFSREPGFIESRVFARLGVMPHRIEIGTYGQFFYYTTYGEVAESHENVLLKLGFLRSASKSPLTAHQMLEQKLASAKQINFDDFSGNGLVIVLSKIEPVFSVFQTLMAVPQLHYSVVDHGIIFSDVMRCIVAMMPLIEIDETVLPQHFLFQSVCGSSTYIRNVKRLLPGHYLQWIDGSTNCQLVRSFDTVSDHAEYIRKDTKALDMLSDSFGEVVRDYTAQIEGKGQGLVNQLSGGIDSSLTQFFIITNSSTQPCRSISYVIQVPAFEYEIDYAREASQLLQTKHTFVHYSPQDYPDLLNRVIDILAQPLNHETTPSLLAIAEYVRAENWSERFFFTGHAADSLFGFPDARKLKGLDIIRKIPFSATLLKGLGTLLTPITARSKTLLKGAQIIASGNDPDSFVSPSNSLLTYDVDWDIVRRCFGDHEILGALAYRRNLSAKYTHSQHYLDKVHFIELVSFTYDLAVKNQQLALTHRMQQVFPFYDEDLMKAAFTIDPDIRYIKGVRYKHLLRRMLEQRVDTSVAHKRKGISTVSDDIVAWMRFGPLKPFVEDIDRPSFLSQKDFDSMIQKSSYFLFSLLTYDIFKKRIIDIHNQ